MQVDDRGGARILTERQSNHRGTAEGAEQQRHRQVARGPEGMPAPVVAGAVDDGKRGLRVCLQPARHRPAPAMKHGCAATRRTQW